MTGGALSSAVFFVTAQCYGWSPERNLVLAIVMGGVYALVARSTGSLLRVVERVVAPRTALQCALCGWGLTSLAPFAFPDSEIALWVAALGGAVTSAITWPVVQSFLSAGRRGRALRSSIGWFNVTWTPATAVPQLAMPLFVALDLRITFTFAAFAAFAAAVVVFTFPVHPVSDTIDDAGSEIGADYGGLARSSGWLLPLGYLMSFTLVPILPHRLEEVGVAATWVGAVGATWMVVRFAVLAVMWRVSFWHGRWGTLLVAAAFLTCGSALVLMGGSAPTVVAGLAVFGAGMALTYYASLYYRMAVGRGAIDAGGNFESLVGLGSFAGPVLGFAGHLTGGAAHGEAVTLALVGASAVAASLLAVRPYRAALLARRVSDQQQVVHQRDDQQ